jgi:NADH-quinone oxidoreductase subunit G
MPRIIINGQEIQAREKIPVLQAALEAGFDVPHYCYHPALKVVASCRLCLMEMKMPDPKTSEVAWSSKLFPSCQTPVREGLEVRFDSAAVRDNVQHTMEYYLLNHPLDCPVCDKAGECWLQDYSYQHGYGTSRAVDPKLKNPKKDIGPATLLYQDRCVLCTRCVRFTEEITGTTELTIVNRGNRAEIDVFPGQPLDDKLQGNVVDLCPVGALLDKEFLFKQRVWFLKSTDSICRACSTGCAIHVDANRDRVWRLRPRFNPGVNDYWICDEGRFGWKFTLDEERITAPLVRRGTAVEHPTWSDVLGIVQLRLEDAVQRHGPAAVAVQLSPEMSCEEAWLLASFVRRIAPAATLALGDVQNVGQDERFPINCPIDHAKFTIHAEKNPNRRGIETLLAGLGGSVSTREELQARCAKGEIKALWVAGGYPVKDWVSKELVKTVEPVELLIVQDTFPSSLSERAELVLPFCAWVEREGSFVNVQGKLQAFSWAIEPPEGAMRDGQYLFALAGGRGLYNAAQVREMMVATGLTAFGELHTPPLKPPHAH